jgi:hypothetical protein
MIKIAILKLIGQNAISMQSGSKLYENISTKIFSKEDVELDFSGVDLFASPFFNASVGLLLKDVSVTDFQQKLKITHINAVGQQLLNLVIANAISFYKNKSAHFEIRHIVRQSLENR